MAYIKCINEIQLGQEATHGSADTLDIQPAGLDVVLNPKVEVAQINPNGSNMPAKYSYVTKRYSEGSISGVMDYNRTMLWFDALFGADATSPHTYIATDGTAPTPKGITLAYGQTGLIYQVAGVTPTNLNIVVASNEPWQFKMDFFGKAVTDGASLASLTEDTPELIHGYETTLYIDEDLDSTIGTTARADVGFRVEANITAGHRPVFHLGDQVWDSTVAGVWGGDFKMVLEADATALDTLGDILDAANTGKGLTIRVQATDGTNTMKLDFAGIAQVAPTLITDDDGIVTIEFDLVPQYNSAYTSCWGAELTIA